MKGTTKLRRLLSLLLCMVMVLGLLPTTAFAKEDTKTTFIVVKMTEPAVGLSIEEVRNSITSQTPGAMISLKSFTKMKDGEAVSSYDTNFLPGFTYRLYMRIVPNEGYTFQGTTDTTVQINYSNLPVTVDRSALEVGSDFIKAYVEWTFPGTAENHRVRGENCTVDDEGRPYFQNSLSAPAGATVFVKADTPPLGQSFDKFVIEPADIEQKYYYTIHNSAEYGIVYDKSYIKFVMPDEDVTVKALYKEDESLVYDMSFEIGIPRPGQRNTDFQETVTVGGRNYHIADYVWFSSMGSRLYHSGDPKPVPFTFKEGETYKCSFTILPKWNCEFVEPYTVTINGKTDGFTAQSRWYWDYHQETIWCDIYLTCSNDLTGTATISNAYYGSPINPTLAGEIAELRDTDYSKLRFQWQRSSSSGWTDISGANNLSYLPTDGDFGKFLRLMITAEGYTGQVASNGVEVEKALVNFAKPASPRLEYSDTYGLEVTNAVKGQEYKVTYSLTTPSDWSDATLATADGTLALSASKNTTVYVYTRVADSAYRPAGMYTECSRVYTGTPTTTTPKDFSINYTTLDLSVGEVVALTALPIPEGATDWNGVQWYSNDTSCAKLYRDKACTQPYDRYTHGNAVTVYLKGISQSNWFTVGAERTFSGSGGIPTTRQMVTRVTDAKGNYLLEWLTFPEVTLAPGESTTVDIGTYPSPALVGVLSFASDSGNPADVITLIPSADRKTLSISVPETARPGTYTYKVKVKGADTKTPSSITINVLDGSRVIPSESLEVRPGSLDLAPGGSAALTAVLTPTNTTDTVTWSRKSGSSKITVDADGVVTVADDAPDGASAVIQAAAGGKTVTCTVKVTTAKYTLNVTGGDALDKDDNLISGPIEAGTLVRLSPAFSAGDAEFIQWVVTSGAATILDPTAPFISFYMPAEDVEIKATFTKANPFTDVSSSAYYYDAVMWAVANGITSGTSETTFSPERSCTRAHAVTFLWNAAGKPTPKSTVMPFTDVPKDQYYYNAVLWAVEEGITSGTSATRFSPNSPCTRVQIVTFLWRWQGEPKVTASNPFTDVTKDQYYYDAVMWAVKEGITNGTSATTFGPNKTCTRAQIVTFLHRYLGP